jgi:hypothetical protein
VELLHTQFPIAAVNAGPGRAGRCLTRASAGCADLLVMGAPRQPGRDGLPAPPTGVLPSWRADEVFAIASAYKPVPRP